jgi:hypothetical protein
MLSSDYPPGDRLISFSNPLYIRIIFIWIFHRLERISIERQEKKRRIKRWRAQRLFAKGAKEVLLRALCVFLPGDLQR